MARQLLGAVVLGLALSACSSQPLGGDSQSNLNGEASMGSVSLPLIATTPDKATYRLYPATFTISGPALGGKPKVVTVPKEPLVEVLKVDLPTGMYSITLENKWVLSRQGPEGGAFAPIAASLITPNPMEVEVNGFEPAEALFAFATTSGEVSLGKGSVNIRIGVQTCDTFDSYMASLGTVTADCLGRVDPRDFSINADGFLVPNFDKCTLDNPLKMRSIRQILSLQYRTATLPNAKACVAGRFSTALKTFLEAEIKECPALELAGIENEITSEVTERVQHMLPKLPSNEPLPPGILDEGPNGELPLLKTFNIYRATMQEKQTCETPENCAIVCAAAFPGFAVGITKDPDGSGAAVRTDPDSWLETTTYLSQPLDPYLKPLFYHPMSYYGGAPGVSFGDPNRAIPCGLDDRTLLPICNAEQCSYWTGSSHKKTRLQVQCNDYNDPDTCTSFCGPLLNPPPPSLPDLQAL